MLVIRVGGKGTHLEYAPPKVEAKAIKGAQEVKAIREEVRTQKEAGEKEVLREKGGQGVGRVEEVRAIKALVGHAGRLGTRPPNAKAKRVKPITLTNREHRHRLRFRFQGVGIREVSRLG